MLLVTSVKLTVLALAAMPQVPLPIGLLGLRVRRLSRAVQDRVADVSTHVDETLHEIRTVQAFTHEAVESATFGARVEAVFAVAVERSGYLALLIAAVIVLAFGAVGMLLWVGAHDVFAGRLSAGSLTAFIFYAVIVANATFVLAEVYGELQRARTRALRAAGRERCRGARRARPRQRARVRRPPSRRPRHAARRARREALGRAAPAHRDRARDPRRPRDPAARRGHELARRREREGGAGGTRPADARQDHAGDRAPARRGEGFQPPPGPPPPP